MRTARQRRSIRRTAGALVGACLGGLLLQVPSAQALPPTNGANASFFGTDTSVRDVITDGTYIYWTNTFGGKIGRVAVNGTTGLNQGFIGALNEPSGLAIQGSFIYWTSKSTNHIGRANLDGTGANESFITGASGPFGLAADASHLYWTNLTTGTIGRADLNAGVASNVNQSFITGASGPLDVVVNASNVFWSNYGNPDYSGNTIGRATLAGGSVNQSFLTAQTVPAGLALDGSFIYWSNYINPGLAYSANSGSVGRAKLDGTQTTQSYLTGIDSPVGLTVDGTYLYWSKVPSSNFAPASIGRATLDSTAPVIAAHADVSVTAANGATSAVVTYSPAVTATDTNDPSGLTVTCSPGTATGGTFSVGVTTVTCNASDPAGNQATPTTFSVTVNGGDSPSVKLTAGGTYTKTVLGVGGVPSSGVSAVVMNVTVTNPTADGFMTVYPCGTVPDASNLNYSAGQTIPNMVVSPVSAGGKVCFYSYAATDLIVDVSGWFPTSGTGFQPLTPSRVLDTRNAIGAPAAKIGTGGVTVAMLGRGGLPGSGVSAVSLNVTAVNPDAAGFVTVYPCGAVPNASNLNFAAHQTVPNAVVTPLSGSGTICLTSTGTTDLLVDINGYFPTGSTAFTPLTPNRLFDTRSGPKVTSAGGKTFHVVNVGGVPASGVAAVSLNVTVTAPSADGFVTVYPCGTVPNASNLNFVANKDVPNAVIAPVSGSGDVCFATSADTHLIADVSGWLPSSGSGHFEGIVPTRIVDTRSGI